jgi:hypothetical protein
MKLASALPRILLLLGFVGIVVSILDLPFANSTILVFAGLGLTFWGALLLYVKPEKYVKVRVVEAILASQLAAVNRLLSDPTHQRSVPVIFPPHFLERYPEGGVFLSDRSDLQAGQEMLSEPHFTAGTYLPSTGRGLLPVLQAGYDGTRTDVVAMEQHLSRLLPQLELAEGVELTGDGDYLHLVLTGPPFTALCHAQHCGIVCPVCASIALFLSSVLRKPLLLDESARSTNGASTCESRFHLLL